MIKLKIIQGRLAVEKDSLTTIEPFKISTNDRGEVWLRGIESQTVFYDFYENFVNADDIPFGDTPEILAYVAPYLGFNTPSGGSGGSEPVEEFNYQKGFEAHDEFLSFDSHPQFEIKCESNFYFITEWKLVRLIFGGESEEYSSHVTKIPLFIFKNNKRFYQSQILAGVPNSRSGIIGYFKNDTDWLYNGLPVGVYFLVDATSSVFATDADNIYCVVKSDTHTIVNTEIPFSSLIPTAESIEFPVFRIECDDVTSIAKFYINGENVATINTDYPLDEEFSAGESFHDPDSKGLGILYTRYRETFGTIRP